MHTVTAAARDCPQPPDLPVADVADVADVLGPASHSSQWQEFGNISDDH